MAPTVIFIRHAESLGNAAVKEYSDAALNDTSLRDCGLSQIGHAQAAGLRSAFTGRTFAAIYCSPARRCRETLLEIYPAAVTQTVRVDCRLAEGRGWAEFNELTPLNPMEWPALWDLTRAAECRERLESIGEMSRRMRGWWIEVSDMVTDGEILVVTHKWPIQLWARDWPEVFIEPENSKPIVFADAAY